MGDWAVIGAGHWGTALAVYLARRPAQVLLWGRNSQRLPGVDDTTSLAPIFPGYSRPDSLRVTADLEELQSHDWQGVVMALPSHAVRSWLQQHRGRFGRQLPPLILTSKGLERQSGARLDEVVAAEWPGPFAVLSGPSFASDLLVGRPLAMSLASRDPALVQRVLEAWRSPQLRLYPTDDVPGVCLAGAIKNVLAIAAGVSDGLGNGDSARAALITRGLAELQRLGTALGGRPETFVGLAGAGDLILTTSSALSRNRRLGLGLGEGRTLAAVLQELGEEVEGVRTAAALYQLAQTHGIDMPITEQVYQLLYADLRPELACARLMQRGLEHA